tara:strand:+ start:449 stop:637 length:189 start_codon:yes stop_codon:yes gene_type:complete
MTNEVDGAHWVNPKVDGVDEPILPITADDVVSIGEFIGVRYFEPYQELRDSSFVGELIQVAP